MMACPFTAKRVLAELPAAGKLCEVRNSVVLGPAADSGGSVSYYHSRLPSKPRHILFISFMYLVGFIVLFTAMMYVVPAGN